MATMDLTGSLAASSSALARGSIAASTVEDSMAAGSTVDAAFMVAATAAVAGSDAVVAFMDVASDAVLQAAEFAGAVSQDTAEVVSTVAVEVVSTVAVEVVSTAVVEDSTVAAAIGKGRQPKTFDQN
jgi:hypothetical protein